MLTQDWTPQVKKFGTASLELDGTGDFVDFVS